MVDLSLLYEIKTQLNILEKEKQKQFEIWVSIFNEKYKSNIKIIPNKFKPSLNDNWLTGFIDAEAEGSFMVSVTKRKRIQHSLYKASFINELRNIL